jgi:RHS repeat-associated protein
VRSLSYDALDRQTGETWSGPGVSPNTLTYTYDAAGNRLTAQDVNGTYTMAYDALNRMTAQQSPFGLTLSYSYDTLGDRVRVQDSLGGVQANSYDATGRLLSRTQGALGQPPLRVDLTYTPDGQIATQTDSALAAQDVAGLDTNPSDSGPKGTDNGWEVGVGNGASAFSSSVWLTDSRFAGWSYVLTGDFTGDGLADVAAYDANTGTWYVATSTGSGLSAFQPWGSWQTGTWNRVVVGDFNGDGKTDIAGWYAANGGWYVLTSNGSSFAAAALWGSWGGANGDWAEVLVGDFNGDGLADIAGRYGPNSDWYVQTSTGSSFSNALWASWGGTSSMWGGVVVGDFNGDGRSDIAGRYDGNKNTYVSASMGTYFSTTVWATLTGSSNGDWVWLVGDFNGDGKADLAGRLNLNYNWYVLASTGTSFAVSQWGGVLADSNSKFQWVAGDFNGDGKTDIAGLYSVNGAWYVLPSTGSSFGVAAWDTWSVSGAWQYANAGTYARRGVTISYGYDPADRLTSITQQTAQTGAVLASYAYSYDPGNRLTLETDNGATTSYNYDAANELTQAGPATFGYDAAGNRTNTGYQTGTGNQLTNDGTWTYTYDGEGNLTKKSQGPNANTWTYGYNLRNQLVWAQDRATDGGTLLSAATYVYDVLGNRIEADAWAQQSGVTTVTRSGYDGSNAWVDLNGGNALVMRRVFLDGPDQPVARVDASGNAAWYLGDHLGSVRAVVNYLGTAVLDQIAYDGYGNVTSESNAAAGDAYKYAAGRYDAITGYTLFGGLSGRYYDPRTGRWTSEDDSGLAAGPNVYEYVHDGPTNATDPSGLLDPTGLMELLVKKTAETGIDAAMARAAAVVEAHPVAIVTVLATYGVALSHEMGHNPNSPVYMGTASGWEFYLKHQRPDLMAAWLNEKPKRAADVAELVSVAKGLGIDAETIAGRERVYTSGDPDEFVKQELREAIKVRLRQLSLVKVAKGQGVKDEEIKGAKSEQELLTLTLKRWAENEGASEQEVRGAVLTNTLPALIMERRASKQAAVCGQKKAKPQPQPELQPVLVGKKVLTKEEEDALKKACFAAGTKLLTPNGFKEIERLRPGDLVLSRPESDVGGPVLPKVIEEAFVATGQILHLHVGERVIRTTPEHPFWVYNKGWVPAGQLRIGDLLVSHDEKVLALTDIHLTEGTETVYNVRVAEFSTYFVGCEEWGFSVWAHNACYFIENGVRRSVAAREYPVAAIPAKLFTNSRLTGQIVVTVDELYSPKDSISASDPRYVRIWVEMNRAKGWGNLPPIEVHPLGEPGEGPSTPLRQVKLDP